MSIKKDLKKKTSTNKRRLKGIEPKSRSLKASSNRLKGLTNLAYHSLVKANFCTDRELRDTEFNILIFGSEYECFEMKDVTTYCPSGRTTTIYSLKYLLQDEFIEILKEKSMYNNRLYCLTQKGRYCVTQFYNQLKEFSNED